MSSEGFTSAASQASIQSASIIKNQRIISSQSFVFCKLIPRLRSLHIDSSLVNELSTDSLFDSTSKSSSVSSDAQNGTPTVSGTPFLRRYLIKQPPRPSGTIEQSNLLSWSDEPRERQMQQIRSQTIKSTNGITMFETVVPLTDAIEIVIEAIQVTDRITSRHAWTAITLLLKWTFQFDQLNFFVVLEILQIAQIDTKVPKEIIPQ